MICWLLAMLGIRRAAVAVRPVGRVRIIPALVGLTVIVGPPGTLIECADRRTAMVCWGIMSAERARITERIEEGRN